MGGQYIVTIFWPRGQNIMGVKISSHTGICVKWAEFSLIIGMDCLVQATDLILNNSVGWGAGIQSAA